LTLAGACQKANWQVNAYCLMPNHYHLALETPEPNLAAGMAWLQEAELFARRKKDAIKLEIAARPRPETTLSTKTIAARVHLGSAKTANRSLRSYMRGGGTTSTGQGQLGI
jgi:REP element-mobilizing transposase RayT